MFFRQYSIRINQQWRICFRWENGNAYDVEIIDYHENQAQAYRTLLIAEGMSPAATPRFFREKPGG